MVGKCSDMPTAVMTLSSEKTRSITMIWAMTPDTETLVGRALGCSPALAW